MGRRLFRLEAIRLVKERGASVVQASRDLDVGENVVGRWIGEFSSEHGQAFPGQGQVRPEQQEIDRLRCEVAKLKAERDILEKMALRGSRHLTVLTPRDRVVDERQDGSPAGCLRFDDGDLAPRRTGRAAASLGSEKPIRQ